MITQEELCNLISQARQSEIRLILTGNVYPQTLDPYVDEITTVSYTHLPGIAHGVIIEHIDD